MNFFPEAYDRWWYAAYLLVCGICCIALPRVHPYDRCMSITSTYVLLAALHVEVPYMPATMFIQTLASIAHWLAYSNKVFHNTDKFLSLGVFMWNVLLILTNWSSGALPALYAAAASASLFKVRVGMREKAFVSYKFLYVLPHTAFRFFAFWFVMLLHGQQWSWGLTLYYWLTGARTLKQATISRTCPWLTCIPNASSRSHHSGVSLSDAKGAVSRYIL